jgi:dienelactone hydrolase
MSAADPTPPPFDAPASTPTSGHDVPAWEARFRARRVGLPDWALDRPDRAVVAATTSHGVLELHSWRVGEDQLLQATSRPDGTATGTISPDGEWLWWFDDDKGDERGVWRRQPFGSGPSEAGGDAIGLPPAYSSGLALGHTVAVVGSSDDGYGVRVHAVRPAGAGTATTQLVYEHIEEAYVGDLSRDEQLVVLAHSEHGDSRHPALRVLRLDDDVTTVADLWDGPGKGLHPSGFSPVAGDSRLLVVHERQGTPALLVWDPVTGDQSDVLVDAPGEVTDADWWPDGRSVLVALDHHARTTLVRVDLTSGTTSPVGPRTGTVTSATVRDDGAVWATWSSAAEPSTVRVLPVGAGEGDVLLRAPGSPPPGSVDIEDVWVDGPGGRVHALLRRPSGATGPLPLVVDVHGGPTWHDEDAFDSYASAWVDHGYAEVQVNYRGSTGYGSAWRDALEERVGHIELEDARAVRDHLVATGIADPDRIVLAGRSWGGFLTLLGLGTMPDAWVVGLAGVPVADYVAAYADEMEGLKAFDRSLFGGSPEQVPEKYADSSPITYVERVTAPVLVLAGENDPRCPIRQIENYLARLDELGLPHEVYRYDAGHGSLVDDERVKHMRLELDFAARHLGTTPPLR